MTDIDHRQLFHRFQAVIDGQLWDRLGEVFQADAVIEYPQSAERFRGLVSIRGQFENYPDMGPGNSELQDVIGGTTYVLTPSYTVVGVEGSGDRGIAMLRVQYPDESRWWVLNLYELKDARIERCRVFFAPEFEAPEWRQPFHDAGR